MSRELEIQHITINKSLYTSFVLVIGILSFVIPCLSLYAGLILCTLILWNNNWHWSAFGLSSINWRITIPRAIAYSIILFVLIEFVISPLIQFLVGDINYSSMDKLRGNSNMALRHILMLWIAGAFGSELVFRGLFIHHLSGLWNGTTMAWVAASVFSSILFGLTYSMLGIAGILYAFVFGLALAYFLYLHPKNLILIMLIHGFFFSFKTLLIYLNAEQIISHYIIHAFN